MSVGGVKPTSSRDGSGIYYLDVLVHRASLPESWLSRFEDGATVLPADAVVPPGGSQSDLDRVDRLTFADSRTVAGVVALRALGRKVTVERTGVTFDGVDRAGARLPRGPAPRHGDHGDRRRPRAATEGPRDGDEGTEARLADPPQRRSTASASSSSARS